MKVEIWNRNNKMFTEVTEKEDIDWSIEHRDWLRYEWTVTFNPKYYCSVQDMEDQIENVVNAIKIKSATTISKNEHIFVNYVKEYQENGNPHLHGTIMTQERITPSLQGSWEQMLKRWYGKSEIWYTGSGNKYHKNDHFEGSWQQYLKKG